MKLNISSINISLILFLILAISLVNGIQDKSFRRIKNKLQKKLQQQQYQQLKQQAYEYLGNQVMKFKFSDNTEMDKQFKIYFESEALRQQYIVEDFPKELTKKGITKESEHEKRQNAKDAMVAEYEKTQSESDREKLELFNQIWDKRQIVHQKMIYIQTEMPKKSYESDKQKQFAISKATQEVQELENEALELQQDLFEKSKLSIRVENIQQKLQKQVLKSLEKSLPQEFCYKWIISEVVCENQKYEVVGSKCLEKCPSGYKRKSDLKNKCVLSCLEEDKKKGLCKTYWNFFNKKIYQRKSKKDNWGDGQDRTESLIDPVESTKAPKATCNGDLKGTVSKSWFGFGDTLKASCEGKLDCTKIGQVKCMSELGCAFNEPLCTAHKVEVATAFVTGILKFTTLFVAPFAANAIEWAVRAVGWAKQIFDIFNKIVNQVKYFVQVYENKIAQAILIQDALEDLRYSDKANKLFEAVIQNHNEQLLKKDPKAEIVTGDKVEQYKLDYVKQQAQLNYLILKQDESNIGKKGNFFNKDNLLFYGKQLLSLGSSVTEAIIVANTKLDLDAKSIGAKIGEKYSDFIDKPYTLFNYDNFAALYEFNEAGNSLEKAKPKDIPLHNDAEFMGYIKASIGMFSIIDPTGLSNIIQALISPTCNFDILKDEQIEKLSLPLPKIKHRREY